MKVGQVAKAAGVSIQTIRFYERRGLLPSPLRLQSGYRDYPDQSVGTVILIKQMQELGFTLRELQHFIHLLVTEPHNPAERRACVEAKLTSIDAQIERLRAMRKELTDTKLIEEIRALGKFRSIFYKAILLDPPWAYSDQGSRVSTGRHYPTLSVETLAALPIAELAAPDGCHLYLWVTNSFMRDAFTLLDAWGFAEKTIITWVKESNAGKINYGFGHYFRNATEHIIFAVRGNLPTLCNDQANVLFSGRTRHSQKPESAYRLIERMSPAPYLELFGRKQRRNWVVWGNEVSDGADQKL